MVPEASHHVRALFRGLAVAKNRIEVASTVENCRVVFRALANARIITMATREFAVGRLSARVAFPRLTMLILCDQIFR
jgi:hypothetical protein